MILISYLSNKKNKACESYDKLNNRIIIPTGLLSFIISMIGFYIVHAAYFVERHVNEDYRHFVTDVDLNPRVFLSASRIALGRFLGGITVYYNSWTTGFICAILLSLTSVMIVKMFDVKNKINVILISLSVVSFLSLASTYGYLSIAQNVSIAIFCSVLAVF